ncbi:MAG: glycosyltransferase [Akkermansiaceae bacterium]|nr:glycosyltransferase [Akkermansiaceae bacterium]
MNFTHLTQAVTTSGGGISEVLRALSSAQKDAGDSPKVLSIEDDGEAIEPWPEGSPEFLAACHFPGMILMPDLDERLDQISPQVLHTHGIWTYLSIGVPRWARRNNKPYIVSPHGMLDSWALDNSKLKKKVAAALYERRHLRGAACLHALCQSEADSIRQFGLKNPIATIPNGIEIPEGRDLKSRYSAENKIMLFLGRLHPKKGLENALRAWAAARSASAEECDSGGGDPSKWQFVIAGWDQGDHELRLKQLCEELELSFADVPAKQFLSLEASSGQLSGFSVVFVGPVFGELKVELLERANVFILPSFSEGLPMSILEAWAYELPVVMTDYCNLPEGFDADAAIHIDTEVESMSAGMLKMIACSEDELKGMGGNGLNLVKEKFTWPTIAAQMGELYQWVRGKASRPSFVQEDG